MLTRGRQSIGPGGEKPTKIGRRNEFQTERGESGFEESTLERLDLTAGWNNDDGRAFGLPGLCASLLEPALNRALPRRFWRRGEEQRMGTTRLKFQFQLHSLILAEPACDFMVGTARCAIRRRIMSGVADAAARRPYQLRS